MWKRSLFCLIVFLLLLQSCSNKKVGEATQLYLESLDSYTNQKYNEALAYIEMINKICPDFYQANLLKGKILFFQGEYDDAIKVFKGLNKKKKEYTEARIWYIRLLILTKDIETARNLLDTELLFNQTDWRFYYLYSMLEDIAGNMDKKILMLNRAELTLTDSAKVYLELSDLWGLLEVPEKSIDYAVKSKIITGTNNSLLELQKIKDERVK